jgi:hypothetical protein
MICDQCETVVHCTKHGCVPKQPAPVQEPVAWVDLLKQAEEVVRSKSLWKKYIYGTPLANDIAVWMASFAQAQATPPAAQPAPVQLVGWMTQARNFVHVMEFTEAEAKLYGWMPVYTAPPAAQRQSARNAWVGLTDEDKLHIEIMGGKSDVMLAEMVEAKLKERNA